LAVISAMFAFGLGTIPSLFVTGCGGYWFFSKINKDYLKFFTKILMSINVIILLIMAFGLIFSNI